MERSYVIVDTNGNYCGSIDLLPDDSNNLEWSYFAWKYIQNDWSFNQVGKHNAENQVELLRALRDAAGISKELDWEVVEVDLDKCSCKYNGEGKEYTYFTMPVGHRADSRTRQVFKDINAKYKTVRVA
jgi:hypothetical protein